MAHVTNLAHTSHRSVFGPLLSAISAAVASFMEARAVEKTYAKLEALSDRELADIGLTRGDILSAALISARNF